MGKQKRKKDIDSQALLNFLIDSKKFNRGRELNMPKDNTKVLSYTDKEWITITQEKKSLAVTKI